MLICTQVPTVLTLFDVDMSVREARGKVKDMFRQNAHRERAPRHRPPGQTQITPQFWVFYICTGFLLDSMSPSTAVFCPHHAVLISGNAPHPPGGMGPKVTACWGKSVEISSLESE